jgi:hypothetical protein
MSKSLPSHATRAETLFARDRTSEQLLFADLKQLVVALALFVEESLSRSGFAVACAISR